MKLFLATLLAISLITSIAFSSEDDAKININEAPVEQLVKLPGIGLVIAERIVQYRQERRFEKIEEIMNVKGIGMKTFQRIKDMITVDSPQTRPVNLSGKKIISWGWLKKNG